MAAAARQGGGMTEWKYGSMAERQHGSMDER